MEQIKIRFMKRFTLTVIAIAATIFAGNMLFAQNAQENNCIEVSARVEKQITPDIIYIGITINGQSGKGKDYIENKEKEMTRLLQELKIDVAKNLTVQDMNSDLKRYFLKKDNILATKSYILKVSAANEVAAVFDALNSIGISDVSLNRTAISPELEKQVKDELLASAAKKALENASILAEAVGNKAGKVIYIQNYYNFAQPYAANFSLRNAKSVATDGVVEESIPTLEISKSTISINVMCRFAIE